MAEAVQIIGLRELDRAFRLADVELQRDFRGALEESAAPVRSQAQTLAGERIRNLAPGDPWSRMRIGRMQGTTVYVAPVERGVKGRGRARRRRPNLADLLMGRALQPALDNNREQVERRVEQLISEVVDLWARA